MVIWDLSKSTTPTPTLGGQLVLLQICPVKFHLLEMFFPPKVEHPFKVSEVCSSVSFKAPVEMSFLYKARPRGFYFQAGGLDFHRGRDPGARSPATFLQLAKAAFGFGPHHYYQSRPHACKSMVLLTVRECCPGLRQKQKSLRPPTWDALRLCGFKQIVLPRCLFSCNTGMVTTPAWIHQALPRTSC